MKITLTQQLTRVDATAAIVPQIPRMAALPMDLTIMAGSGAATLAGIASWVFTLAPDYSQGNKPLALVDTGFTVLANVVSFTLATNTEEMADYLGSQTSRRAVAQLRGFAMGATSAAFTLTFKVELVNVVPDGSECAPTPVIAYYTAAQVDALVASKADADSVPTDISDLTDDSGLLFSGNYNDLSDKPTIPADLNDLNDVDDKLHGPVKEVTSLPATPIAGQMIRLTTADDTAKAAPGIYSHDGVGWSCISYESAYALGNLGATPSLTLIPGAAYTATVDAEITTFTAAFTRPGLVSITLTNASEYAVAQPTMTGRTSKLLAEAAWDGAATALSKALIEDDGTYIIVSAGGLA